MLASDKLQDKMPSDDMWFRKPGEQGVPGGRRGRDEKHTLACDSLLVLAADALLRSQSATPPQASGAPAAAPPKLPFDLSHPGEEKTEQLGRIQSVSFAYSVPERRCDLGPRLTDAERLKAALCVVRRAHEWVRESAPNAKLPSATCTAIWTSA